MTKISISTLGILLSVFSSSISCEQKCFEAKVKEDSDWKKPCEHEFCPRERYEFAVADTSEIACYTALGNACAGQLDEGGYFYAFADDEVTIEIELDATDQKPLTEAALVEGFNYIYMKTRLQMTPQEELFIVNEHRINGMSNLPGITVSGRRISGKIEFTTTDAYYNLFGIDDDCLVGDIGQPCQCYYKTDEFNIGVSIDITLADIQ